MTKLEQARDLIQEVLERAAQRGATPDLNGIVHLDTRCNLRFTVHCDIRDASNKLVMKIDSSKAPSLSSSEVAEKNLLKGITADKSTSIHVNIPLPCNLYLAYYQRGMNLCNSESSLWPE
jgi:hypothetical protein